MAFIGVSPHVSDEVMSLYNNPSFRVRDSQQTSEVCTQTKGLRQGCPLSPYLFSMVLSHLFHDDKARYTFLYGLIPGILHTPSPLWDLEYADYTVLLSKSAQHATRMLHLIQRFGAQRGLLLNEDKCDHLRLNSDQRIYYSANTASPFCNCESCTGNGPIGSPVRLSNEVKYLGVYLDTSGNSRKNTSYRISRAIHSSRLFKPLLSHSSLPPSWKLTVYRSIVLSILMYAADSVLLSSAQLTKLNSVHFRSLCRIFQIKSSYYHRVLNPTEAECSNEYLAGLAFSSRRVITPSQSYSQQRLNDILIPLSTNPPLCNLVPIALFRVQTE